MAKSKSAPRAKSRRRKATITFASPDAVSEFVIAAASLSEGYHDYSHQFDELESLVDGQEFARFPATMKIEREYVEAAREAASSATAMSDHIFSDEGRALGPDDIKVEGDEDEPTKPERRLWIVIDLSWGDKTILGATAWSSEEAAREAAGAIETLNGKVALVSAPLDTGLSKDS